MTNHQVVFSKRYFRRKELSETLDFKKDAEDQESQHESEQDFAQGPCPTVRQKLWDILEKPGSSTASRIFGVISIVFVVVSIANMALMSAELSWLDLQVLEILEYFCISWFTGEFALRFLCVRDRCCFLRKVPNIIDLLAILPFYITLLVESLSGSETTQDLENVGRIVQVLRLLRALRMLKLGRHSTGIQSSRMYFSLLLFFKHSGFGPHSKGSNSVLILQVPTPVFHPTMIPKKLLGSRTLKLLSQVQRKACSHPLSPQGTGEII